jgi:hypothetical protein
MIASEFNLENKNGSQTMRKEPLGFLLDEDCNRLSLAQNKYI